METTGLQEIMGDDDGRCGDRQECARYYITWSDAHSHPVSQRLRFPHFADEQTEAQCLSSEGFFFRLIQFD